MTVADKIYVALIEDMKKYGADHSVHALQYYITEYNNLGFTSDNNARAIISQLTPQDIMAETLRGILKYQIIVKQKELPMTKVNEQEVMKTIYEFNHNQKITSQLQTADIEGLVNTMVSNDEVENLLNLLFSNSELFQNYLILYVNLLCNYINDMNKIDNNNFPQINDYFSQFEQDIERHR